MQWMMKCTHDAEMLVFEQEESIYVSELQEFPLQELPEDVKQIWADMRKNLMSHVLGWCTTEELT